MRNIGYIWGKQAKKMNEKEIQSFSLSRLLEYHELRPGDLYYDGCLIASRVDSHCDIRSDLFRYPIRINALALVFCSKGSITLTSNLTHRQLSEHTLYIHFPGSILQVDPIEGVELYAVICEEEFIRRINVDLKLLSRLFLRLERQPLLQLDDEQWQEIMRSFDEISHERDLYRDDAYSIEILRSAIRMLIYKVSRIIDRYSECPHTEQDVHSPRNRQEEYFQRFMNVLTQHYTQERSVGFYASQLNLTPKYLSTLIRQTTGRTASEWIDDYVILDAKNLLKYSTMSIQEISYSLNFPNQSFFGKYFKTHTGQTPSEYRMSR